MTANLIDIAQIKIAGEFMDVTLEIPIICCKAEKIVTKNKKDSKIYVVATTGLFILQKGKKSKVYAPPRKVSWLSLLTLSLTSHKSIVFQFSDEKIEITHKDYKTQANVIRNHLYTFMREFELPVFSFPEEIQVKKQIVPFIRFQNLMTEKHKGLTSTTMKSYQDYFAKNQSEFKLSIFSDILKTIEPNDFFDSIQYFQDIAILTVDYPIKDAFVDSLIAFLKSSRKIKVVNFCSSITITGDFKTPYISSMIETINVFDITLNENSVKFLASLVNSNSLAHISFSNSLTGELFDKFFSSLESMNSVQTFSMNKAKDIKLEKFYQFAQDFSEISFTNCGIDVSEFLSNVDSFQNVQKIDLSYNHASALIPHPVLLPHNFQMLKLDHVTFQEGTFKCIFNIFAKINNPVVLSLSNIGFSSMYTWDDFFDEIMDFPNVNVKEMIWDENQLEKEFFKYLLSLESLQKLSIFNSFKLNKQAFYMLAKFILKTTQLRELNISIDKGEMQEAESQTIFESIVHNSSITHLSMLGFAYKKIMFDNLINALFENKKITDFDYDFIDVDNAEFERFVDSLVSRGPPLRIPEEYVSKFLTDDNIKSKFKLLNEGDKSVVITESKTQSGHYKLSLQYGKNLKRRGTRESSEKRRSSMSSIVPPKSSSEVDSFLEKPGSFPSSFGQQNSFDYIDSIINEKSEENKERSEESEYIEGIRTNQRETQLSEIDKEIESIQEFFTSTPSPKQKIFVNKKPVEEEKWEIVVDNLEVTDTQKCINQLSSEYNILALLNRIRNA